MIAFRIFGVLLMALPLVGCSDRDRAEWLGDCNDAKAWQSNAQKTLLEAEIIYATTRIRS